MNERQHATLLSCVVAAALIGTLLGLVDFFLFEVQGHLAGFTEYVLYKPSLFGLSLLSFQVLAFAALGMVSFCLSLLLWLIVGNLFPRRGGSALLPLSLAILAVGTIALRVYMNSQQAYRLAILVIGSAVLVFVASRIERCGVRPEHSSTSTLLLSVKLQFGALSLVILSSFLSPDVYSAYLRAPSGAQKPDGNAPNVLLVVLDAVRADHLSCYGYKRGTTPNIDRVAREGVLFRNAFSAAPWTLPSHASMFTGRYPSEHHADWGHAHLDKGLPTLAEQLQGGGYQTVGFSENVFVGRSFGLARGFGEFHETWRRPLVVRAIARVATTVLGYKEGRESAERSVGILERWVLNNEHRGKPFFAFVNLMAAHLPRYPRPGFGCGDVTKETLARIEPVNLIPERYYLPKYALNQRELGVMVDIYDSEISYLDSQIGEVMSFLERTGLREKTIVIVTSDHGENFGEHGLIEHQFCLYDTLLRVPLIVRHSGVLKRETVEKMVSTVFLGRAVMEMVGSSGGRGSEHLGIGALGELEGQDYVIAECSNGVEVLRGVVGDEDGGVDLSRFDRSLKCIVEGDYKFIWSSNGAHELYRIGEDRREAENLIGKEQERVRSLDQALKAWELVTRRRQLF